MPTPIRFRTDGSLWAEYSAEIAAGKSVPDWLSPDEVAGVMATPPAEPGDAWRLTYHDGEQTAGYAICCPKCRRLHYWTSASNCGSKRQLEGGGWTCDHQRARTSCWTWTTDDTGRPITAVASLYARGECGYHGFLVDGALTDG